MGDLKIPTDFRFMTEPEWRIVARVFTEDKLPYRRRILLSNGAGAGGAPFTIPTSLASTAFGTAVTLPIGGAGGLIGYLGSAVNLGYIMNLGSGFDEDLSKGFSNTTLLVHETTHVWQGRNSTFALSYVISSVTHQCAGMLHGGGLAGRDSAYNFDAGKAWGDYNAEQQAYLVETWFGRGEKEDDVLFPYIRDYVRQGKTG